MGDTPHYMGLNEFIEELSRELGAAPLKARYRSCPELLNDLEAAAHRFLEQRLRPLGLSFALWRGLAEPGADGIEPAVAFGTEFTPHMTITVGNESTLAIVAGLIQPRLDTAAQIATTIGTALICSWKYPAVLALIYQSKRAEPYKRFLDHEVRTGLWNNCKVKLVLR